MSANIERMINAAVAKEVRGRTSARSPAGSRAGSSGSQRGCNNQRVPNPRFEGCWCCGEKGHSRQDCSKFKAIKAANGGKFPQGYEGAYEKSMKKTRASRHMEHSTRSRARCRNATARRRAYACKDTNLGTPTNTTPSHTHVISIVLGCIVH